MIFDYRELPSSGGARPFLDVLVGAVPFRTAGLVDSGAVNGLFHIQVAREAELDLSSAERRPVLVGSDRQVREAAFLTVPLEAAGLAWEAEVGFCDWIPLDWGVLGHISFFRWFTVTFRAYDGEFEVEPIAM